ncbi:MAG: MurT ligase domain-containing protein [bacterium]|nr:MurT ligase domain-containing protein [bacterium]
MLDQIRLYAGIAAGKSAAGLCRILGAGGGTNWPGKLSLAICPEILSRLSREFQRGSIVVTGTNGKTTATRMLAHVFSGLGWEITSNFTGANLLAGVTAAVVRDAGLTGRIKSDLALLEADEASVPRLSSETRPRAIVVTNIFRDQLDRYGELDNTARLIGRGLSQLEKDDYVFLNADDPYVAALGKSVKARVVYFGMDCDYEDENDEFKITESRYCRDCGGRLTYGRTYYSHLGTYICLQCGLKRPDTSFTVTGLQVRGIDGYSFRLASPLGQTELRLKLPGFYNIYNALAVAACAVTYGADLDLIRDRFGSFTSAFGRMERLSVNGRKVYIVLVKNPVGLNEALHTVVESGLAGHVMIAINDNFADGRDVSWLWDGGFEMLGRDGVAGRKIIVSGIRAEDMALRLKYAGLDSGIVEMDKDIGRAMDTIIAAAPEGYTVCIMCTYTAMLTLRGVMERRGYLSRYWEA